MDVRRLSLAGLLWLAACAAQSTAEPAVGAAPDPVTRPLHSPVTPILVLAGGCTGCHGPGGISHSPTIPSIAGLPEGYFTATMEAYQYGGRYSSLMGRIALGYDRGEIRRLARYFGTLPGAPMRQRVDWGKVALGRRLHRRYCQECHASAGIADGKGGVSLDGQWMGYLRWTLRDYLVGINQDETEMSLRLAQLLGRHGEAGLEALLNYYASRRP